MGSLYLMRIMSKELKNENKIIVRGARTHNLKNISVEMPRNKMIVFTGLSGSGKSSLAFDTIFAEGQRRYVESLSAYARQFLRQMPKPDVDEIEGLSPAISIDQKSRSNNPRSTVATITEIYDYLRVLYARIGKPHCLICGDEIKKLSNEEIINFIKEKVSEVAKAGGGLSLAAKHGGTVPTKRTVLGVTWDETKIQIFSPLVRGRKGEYYQLLYDLLGKGYVNVRVDGEMHNLREQIIISKTKKHDIDVLVDEFMIHEFSAGKRPKSGKIPGVEAGPLIQQNHVAQCPLERDPRSGLGKLTPGVEKNFRPQGDDSDLRLSESVERAILESDGLVTIAVGDQEILFSTKFSCPKDGFSFPEVEPRLFSFNSPHGACEVCHGLGTKHLFGDEPCDACHGKRLRPEALNVFIGSPSGRGRNSGRPPGSGHLDPGGRGEFRPRGDGQINIVDFTSLSVEDAFSFIKKAKLSAKEREISSVLLREIESRLQFLLNVGLEYLTLDRRANTLSGGEAQRIRLASQLGSRLVGALYVLDEPTIGLHQRDNEKLIKTLTELRDLGNTIIVVEHDEDTIYSSDYIVDIGPKAGVHGGEIVVADYLDKLLTAKKNDSNSRTLAYLREEEKIPVPEKRRESNKGSIKNVGAKIFNINNQNAEIPLGKLVCITGVSGSGKSSFLYEVLHKNCQAKFEYKYRSNEIFNCSSISGTEYLTRAILIDQSPIGRTPRSNIATYTGAFSHIRDLFAETEEARFRGWKSNRFSFNVKGGRCEACEGNGEIAVEMHFLPTVYVTCDICGGKRFDKETLKVKFKKKNIYDVLRMTIEEGVKFFEDIPAISDRLNTL
ncbi:MAG: UvrABC system protein A, partial [Candidatus Nomurabacteria bacterium GW2011_GWB1_37_5]